AEYKPWHDTDSVPSRSQSRAPRFAFSEQFGDGILRAACNNGLIHSIFIQQKSVTDPARVEKTPTIRPAIIRFESIGRGGLPPFDYLVGEIPAAVVSDIPGVLCSGKRRI